MGELDQEERIPLGDLDQPSHGGVVCIGQDDGEAARQPVETAERDLHQRVERSHAAVSRCSGCTRSTSSVRAVPTMSNRESGEERTRKWRNSRDSASHHWRSSRTSSSGAVPAVMARASASNNQRRSPRPM